MLHITGLSFILKMRLPDLCGVMEAIEGSWINGAEAVVDKDAAEQEREHKLQNLKKCLFSKAL